MRAQADKHKLRMDRYLTQIRRDLKFHPRIPQNIKIYGYIATFTDDVKDFQKAVFRIYKGLQKEVKEKVYVKPDIGSHGYLYRRSEIALRNCKKLLYYLSDIVDVKPSKFYAKTTGLETCGDTIVDYINRI